MIDQGHEVFLSALRPMESGPRGNNMGRNAERKHVGVAEARKKVVEGRKKTVQAHKEIAETRKEDVEACRNCGSA